MANKIIAVCDLDNFNKQNAEALLIASIFEKKYDSVAVLDLNDVDSNSYVKKLNFKQKGQILTAKIFNITSYHFLHDEAYNGGKALNLTKTLALKNEILIINSCFSQYFLNTDYYKLADRIIIFSKLSDMTPNNLISFFLLHKIEDVKVHLFIFNDEKNIQKEKSFISLRKQLAKSNVLLENVYSLPYFKDLDAIQKIDPWLDIYKRIIKLD